MTQLHAPPWRGDGLHQTVDPDIIVPPPGGGGGEATVQLENPAFPENPSDGQVVTFEADAVNTSSTEMMEAQIVVTRDGFVESSTMVQLGPGESAPVSVSVAFSIEDQPVTYCIEVDWDAVI